MLALGPAARTLSGGISANYLGVDPAYRNRIHPPARGSQGRPRQGTKRPRRVRARPSCDRSVNAYVPLGIWNAKAPYRAQHDRFVSGKMSGRDRSIRLALAAKMSCRCRFGRHVDLQDWAPFRRSLFACQAHRASIWVTRTNATVRAVATATPPIKINTVSGQDISRASTVGHLN